MSVDSEDDEPIMKRVKSNDAAHPPPKVAVPKPPAIVKTSGMRSPKAPVVEPISPPKAVIEATKEVKEEPVSVVRKTAAADAEASSDDGPIGLKREKAVPKPATTKAVPAKDAIAKPSAAAKAAKKEPVKNEATTSTMTQIEKIKKERKVFDLPGQSKETPPEGDALRVFYTSLFIQRPESDMALKWCLAYGTLSKEVASEALIKLGKAARSTPVKQERPAKNAAKPVVKKEAANSVVKKEDTKRPRAKVQYDHDDDFDNDDDSKGGKKPAAKKAAGKKVVKNVATDDDDESDDDKPLVAKNQPAAAKAVKKETADLGDGDKLISTLAGRRRPGPAKKAAKDVAFADGGLDDKESDDELPLSHRIRSAT